MAVNLLTITKEANGYFTFVLNGDTANAIKNTRNDLTTVGDLCHFKTSNGANLISQQNVIYSNVTIIDGVTSLVPTSVDDLFAKLISVDFFDWLTGGGSGGVDRFEDLIDTFEFTNQENKAVFVNASATALEPRTLTLITVSTGLSDMPNSPVANQMLVRNPGNTAWVQQPVPAGANGYVQAFTYSSPDAQEFTLATTASLISVVIDGGLADPVDWQQVGNLLTILPTYTLADNARIIVTGVI